VGHRITIGTLAGIEVRLHRSWAIIALLVAWSFWNRFVLLGFGAISAVIMGVLGALLFFLSVLFHEFAHALEAQHRGVEVSGITLFLFGGVTEMSGQVRRPRDEFALTAVGPFSSIVLAAAFGLVAVYSGRLGFSAVAQVAGLLGWINLALGLFNLLPGAPLDGGRILRSLVWAVTGDRRRALRVAARMGQLIGALIASLGVLQLLLVPGGVVGGIWLVVIGGFLAVAAQGEIAQQSLGEALGGHTVGELLRREELASVRADTDLASAVERLRVAPESVLAVRDGSRTVGVLLLDDLAQLEGGDQGRAVREVMVPVEELQVVDHRAEITEALGEMGSGRPLAVSRRDDGEHRIEGVLAPEQLQRVARRTLQLGSWQESGASAGGGAPEQDLPGGGRWWGGGGAPGVPASSPPASMTPASSSGPSLDSRLAPVREPSPPITTSASMSRVTRLRAALRRPSRVRNSSLRAVPIAVPPWCRMPPTWCDSAATMASPPSIMPT